MVKIAIISDWTGSNKKLNVICDIIAKLNLVSFILFVQKKNELFSWHPVCWRGTA